MANEILNFTNAMLGAMNVANAEWDEHNQKVAEQSTSPDKSLSMLSSGSQSSTII